MATKDHKEIVDAEVHPTVSDDDADTKVHCEESADDDVIRFDLGDTTLSAAAEVLTIQAIDGTYVKIEPSTDNIVDLGSATKEFRNLYVDGTANIDTLAADSATLTTGIITTLGGAMDCDNQAMTNVNIDSGSVAVADVTASTSLTINGSTPITSIDTDLSSASGSDDTLASAKAILAAITANSGGKYSIGVFSQAANASGTDAVSGLSFQPSIVLFHAINGGKVSFGADDGTNTFCNYLVSDTAAYSQSSTQSIRTADSAGVYQSGKVTAIASDGFTVTWTPAGSQSGTVSVIYIALG